MVAVGGGVQAIKRVGGGCDRGKKTKTNFGSNNIVVDCFWNANNVQALVHKMAGRAHGSVATNHNDGVKAMAPRGLDAALGHVAKNRRAVFIIANVVPAWVATIVAAQNSSAAHQNSSDITRSQRANAVVDQALKAIFNANHFNATLQNGGLGHCANHGVQAGAIAAAGENANATNMFWRCHGKRQIVTIFCKRATRRHLSHQRYHSFNDTGKISSQSRRLRRR